MENIFDLRMSGSQQRDGSIAGQQIIAKIPDFRG